MKYIDRYLDYNGICTFGSTSVICYISQTVKFNRLEGFTTEKWCYFDNFHNVSQIFVTHANPKDLFVLYRNYYINNYLYENE